MPGSCAQASAWVEDANSGAFALARAAPRANAISGSSGALTGSVVAASSAGLIIATLTPEPTTNSPSGCDSSRSAVATSLAISATAVSSSLGSSRRYTSVIEPSAESTTANVAVSGSTNNNPVLA
ncbi:hypothetical protein C1Y40_05657 [Mycobacterium talmoniae]|uniref:Uncharacterized protein n=1 Tax=Mycobacterium talmoniae TaxID=1858794 RepID=A0A2S8BC05_9MYCO|nr:hypothetical protein C1Y40_05657 [Mycobacterium talmoniae]